MLLVAGSSVHDLDKNIFIIKVISLDIFFYLHGPGCSLILVLWHAILSPVESIVASIQSGQHVIGTGHTAGLGLLFLFVRIILVNFEQIISPYKLTLAHLKKTMCLPKTFINGFLLRVD